MHVSYNEWILIVFVIVSFIILKLLLINAYLYFQDITWTEQTSKYKDAVVELQLSMKVSHI